MNRVKERITGRNQKKIYSLIRKQGVVSKVLLAEQCKMTASTLARALEELTIAGLIHEAGRGESRGGRKPILYSINPAYGYVFGLDISRSFSRLILCDISLNKLDSITWAMTREMTPEGLLDGVVIGINTLLKKHKISREQVIGIGVGAVGPLDRTTGIIVDPLYFPTAGWNNVPVIAYIQDRLALPVIMDNGANAAIWAEYWEDKPEHYEHLLYIRAGVGLRSAMMTNGQIVYGAVDMEGSVGQMIIQTDGVRHRHREDSYGCLESYVSTYAMEQQAISLLKQGRATVLREMVRDLEAVEIQHLLQALERNDQLMVELFTQAATYFGIGLANLLNTLHPQKVILGGPLITGSDMFFRVSTQIALRNTYYSPVYHVEFKKEKLGEETIAIGAASMVINALSE